VIPILTGQIAELVTRIQKLVESAIDGEWNPVNAGRDWLSDTFPLLQVDVVLDYHHDWWTSLDFAHIGPGIGTGLLPLGAGLVAFATGAIIVTILTIYFTASMRSLKRSIYQLVPASKRERFIDLAEQISASVGYYVMGQVTLGVINGILSAIFLSIIG